MTSINHPNLTPLLRLYIKETDTQEIVDLAMEIAEKHQYYLPEREGVPASFHTFVTKEECTYRDGSLHGILVKHGSVFETERFKLSLVEARKQIKQP